MQPLPTGTRLGPYEIVNLAGAGGMGEVYRARDTRLNRTVALKVFPSGLTSDPDAKQRFEREAQAVAALSHPHICNIFDVGQHAGTDFLVMEYLEGETLTSRLATISMPYRSASLVGSLPRSTRLPPLTTLGIVHRDIKPGNIMLTKGGAKLLDFGLAKPREHTLVTGPTASTTAAPLTGEGTILGTL